MWAGRRKMWAGRRRRRKAVAGSSEQERNQWQWDNVEEGRHDPARGEFGSEGAEDEVPRRGREAKVVGGVVVMAQMVAPDASNEGALRGPLGMAHPMGPLKDKVTEAVPHQIGRRDAWPKQTVGHEEVAQRKHDGEDHRNEHPALIGRPAVMAVVAFVDGFDGTVHQRAVSPVLLECPRDWRCEQRDAPESDVALGEHDHHCQQEDEQQEVGCSRRPKHVPNPRICCAGARPAIGCIVRRSGYFYHT